MKIFVARLPYQFQEAQIADLFAPYGEVKSVNLIMDRETGRSKCFAFVEMPDNAEAANAIAELNERQVMDKNIAVSEAREKERPAGGGGFGGGNRNFGGGGGGYRDRNSGGGGDRRGGGGGGYNRDRNSGGGGGDRRGGNSGYRGRSSEDSDY
ncbi:RNA recognition motif domain-containing protein [Mucilaginibacter auburnensis]|uniref:RNA recognition motif-containing protein n=1 Tax=Mucilaginibacter auburnensis TaxID=1457233 RepID=A0A2H9VUX2_9SPHI|nr:RNA-binding protein [Mucilaginibacter auburnensis]PJJ84592.1 RNA recognition motif-containing protein [Mucilaginibacter auburnensis]